MVRSLAAILEQIDTTYETAGQTLGASKLTAARTITLPLFRAGLVTGIILCFARSLSETGGTMIALSTMANSQGFQTGPTIIGTWKPRTGDPAGPGRSAGIRQHRPDNIRTDVAGGPQISW